MRRVNGYDLQSALRSELHKDSRLKEIGDSKVSNLKMADYDKEIPFGDGFENRGVDDDDEIEMRNLDPYDSSSRRGSEDTTYRSSHSRAYGETSFIEGIDEHTPLIKKKVNGTKLWL